jgi:hypothetical protein
MDVSRLLNPEFAHLFHHHCLAPLRLTCAPCRIGLHHLLNQAPCHLAPVLSLRALRLRIRRGRLRRPRRGR